MDPAAFSFETATTLISALTLFLSRLDSRRRRSRESPNVQDSLIILSAALLTWLNNAEETNHIVRTWAKGDMPTSRMQQQIAIDRTQQQQMLWIKAKHQERNANSLTRRWLTYGDARPAVEVQVEVQRASMRDVDTILSGRRDSKPLQDIRNLLRLYGPELLKVLDTAITGRKRLLEELGEELRRLREKSPEELAETLKRLESTSRKLRLASKKLDWYIQTKFPLNGTRPL